MLAATGGTLHRFSLSLQDISRIIQLAAGKISDPGPVAHPETAALRGTIFDRNFKELSVSYQLYSLYVHPDELPDKRQAVEVLAPILDMDKELLADRLNSGKRVVSPADDLDGRQAAEIAAHGLKGVICKPVEARYYPAHSMAAHLLGFTSRGTGLSGVEAVYDPVLHPGEFSDTDVPEVDLTGVDKLGRAADDIILTIDLDLQKQVELQLQEYRRKKGAARGAALVIEPGSGRVLAMVSQPGFDPNYFWQADGTRLINHVFSREFDPGLFRPLLLRAAAVYEGGMEGSILPPFVRAPDYGLSKEKIAVYMSRFALDLPVEDPLAPDRKRADAAVDSARPTGLLSPAQMAVGGASLVNGGNRVSPFVLEGLYDHAGKRIYQRDSDLVQRERIIAPAAGIHLRRELLLNSPYGTEKGFVFTNKVVSSDRVRGFNEFRIQEVLLTAVPCKVPRVLLLMAVDYRTLYPLPVLEKKKKKQKPLTLVTVGNRLLPVLERCGVNEHVAEHPAAKAEENYRRFLISRRLDLPPETKKTGMVARKMPDLSGLSLRKGLRQISSLGLQVSISGSGRIVRQSPEPGTLLSGSQACRLELESRI